MNKTIRVAHLFAGAGGGLYADLISGHTPVLAIEIDKFCCEVLNERKLDGCFPNLHVHCGDVRDFDFGPWAGKVDQISAGFPCQDISCAGKGAGIDGERSGLWREVIRAARVIRPKFVFLENSPQIRTRGRHVIIGELVALGYSWRDGFLSASDVGALHKRDRWWCLASDSTIIKRRTDATSWDYYDWHDPRWQKTHCRIRSSIKDDIDEKSGCGNIADFNSSGSPAERENNIIPKFAACYPETPYAMRERLQNCVQRGWLSEADSETIQAAAGYTGNHNWSSPDAGVLRVVHGMANRGHRIKSLGNGQVPLQAATAWRILSGE